VPDGAGLPGVTWSALSRDDAIALGVQAPFDRIAATAMAQAPCGVHIDVAAGFDGAGEAPVVVDMLGTGAIAFEHVLITVGDGARVTIVVRHAGLATLGELVNLDVGAGAEVTFVSLQLWDAGAVHAGQHSILVGRDARVRKVTASFGGDVVRLFETARFDGPGGSLEQFGVYFADATQHLEHRLIIDHDAPHTASHVDYRGALQGAGAHASWVGDVLIRAVAEDIETYETNRNLVLTDGCWVNSVPNLEIETGQIRGAGHSSATGRFDDEQLFYLRSRGIPENEARRLVVRGFFADLIRRIGVPEVEETLSATVERELGELADAGREPGAGASATTGDAPHASAPPRGGPPSTHSDEPNRPITHQEQ